MPIERTTGGTSLIDVLDRVLDKGIVIDAWVRVSLVGIDLITVEARVVVASIDTYLKYSESMAQVAPVSRPAAVASQEAVLAENAALRAQLAATTSLRRRTRRARAARRARPDRPVGLGRDPRRCVRRERRDGLSPARGTARPSRVSARLRGPRRDGGAVSAVARRARRCAGGPLPRCSIPERKRLVHLTGFGVQPVTDQRLRRRPGGARSPPGPGPERVAARGPGPGDRGSPVLASHARPGLAASWDGRPRGGARRAAPRPPRHGERGRPRVGIRVPRLPARARPAPVHRASRASAVFAGIGISCGASSTE